MGDKRIIDINSMINTKNLNEGTSINKIDKTPIVKQKDNNKK